MLASRAYHGRRRSLQTPVRRPPTRCTAMRHQSGAGRTITKPFRPFCPTPYLQNTLLESHSISFVIKCQSCVINLGAKNHSSALPFVVMRPHLRHIWVLSFCQENTKIGSAQIRYLYRRAAKQDIYCHDAPENRIISRQCVRRLPELGLPQEGTGSPLSQSGLSDYTATLSPASPTSLPSSSILDC